jgi:hypothetical protein
MGAVEALGMALTALEHAAALSAIYQKAQAEGRADLTADEVAAVRAAALASISKLAATLA